MNIGSGMNIGIIAGVFDMLFIWSGWIVSFTGFIPSQYLKVI
jgi:hypothetical protein